MAGQAATMTRDQVRSKIKSIECNKGKGGSAPKMSLKTTSKQ